MGETGRSLNVRLKEHRRSVSNNDARSVVARHCWDNNHTMNYNDCKIVHNSNDFGERRLIEGVLIDTCNTLDGNKSFSKLDHTNRKRILYENKLLHILDTGPPLSIFSDNRNPLSADHPAHSSSITTADQLNVNHINGTANSSLDLTVPASQNPGGRTNCYDTTSNALQPIYIRRSTRIANLSSHRNSS